MEPIVPFFPLRLLLLSPALSFLMFASVATQTAYAQTTPLIEINNVGNPAFLPFFEHAASVWGQILERQDGEQTTGFGPFTQTNSLGPLVIDVGVFSFEAAGIENPPGGNILAQAGPTAAATDDSGFVLVTEGQAQFDLDDLDVTPNGVDLVGDGDFANVVLHEFGHILGFVPGVFQANGVFAPEDQASDTTLGQYTGDNGLRLYNEEFGLNEEFVPIENGGPAGTANAHFDEEFFGVALNGESTVLAEPNINDIRFGPNSDELLTGVISDDVFISNTTGGIFQDIGFDVDFDAIAAFNAGEFVYSFQTSTTAVPEPSSTALLFSVSLLVAVRRNRQS